jgi:glycosyltransferase involved in cell wall biosynthesis
MTAPLVSVCLPNLNTLPFLKERIDTIQAQTYPAWELVVSDNHSDDGAWEFFQALAERDPRVRLAQAPRQGMYANWNRAIERASGEYVYIATSDDTMAPDCLEKLVSALDAHPDCDLAHCPLRTIDENGRDMPVAWARSPEFALSSGPLIDRRHVRRAPFDGVLHLLGGSVYISITQLLVRRSLFDRIGMFESRWGSLGDFNWNMRAALVVNTVHVPDTWGGWRCHPSQATALARFGTAEHALKVDEMIDHAIAASRPHVDAALYRQLTRWAADARALRAFQLELAARRDRSRVRRGAFLARHVLGGSTAAHRYLLSRLLRRTGVDWVRRNLREVLAGPALVPAA